MISLKSLLFDDLNYAIYQFDVSFMLISLKLPVFNNGLISSLFRNRLINLFLAFALEFSIEESIPNLFDISINSFISDISVGITLHSLLQLGQTVKDRPGKHNRQSFELPLCVAFHAQGS